MAYALRLASTEIFNASNGDRPHATNVIILVTDGQPSDSSAVLSEVNIIKALGIRIVGVGIGTGVSD